jgi:CDP-glucose 4,6-dehydratase
MEDMVIDRSFWRGRRIFLTGHTGFKGGWLSQLLARLGADVHGYALPPEHDTGIFTVARVERDINHRIGDVRDRDLLEQSLRQARPEIVIHMAAQSLVRRSYEDPVETYATNVMGTVNLLEAVRRKADIGAVIVVTSDKCYENQSGHAGYRETDPMGGYDPYSNSKGCAELVTAAYRQSFFFGADACLIASARAGNVIGGGDWAVDRLVPDAMRAFLGGSTLRIRYPDAIRPWQHVLDPLTGYLLLAQRLCAGERSFAGGWNFGPEPDSEVRVGDVVSEIVRRWGSQVHWEIEEGTNLHEAPLLKLDCSKARSKLGWKPAIGIAEALDLTVAWYRTYGAGGDLRAETLNQIDRHCLSG